MEDVIIKNYLLEVVPISELCEIILSLKNVLERKQNMKKHYLLFQPCLVDIRNNMVAVITDDDHLFIGDNNQATSIEITKRRRAAEVGSVITNARSCQGKYGYNDMLNFFDVQQSDKISSLLRRRETGSMHYYSLSNYVFHKRLIPLYSSKEFIDFCVEKVWNK